MYISHSEIIKSTQIITNEMLCEIEISYTRLHKAMCPEAFLCRLYNTQTVITRCRLQSQNNPQNGMVYILLCEQIILILAF